MNLFGALILVAGSLAPAADSAPGLRVPPGFEVREFAGDDLAHDIFTMTLDPQGRVVVAGRGYIRLLIDDDGDGHADRAIQVADTPKDGAMGLLWEGDTLYAVGDGGLRRFKIGPDGKALGPSELLYKLKTGGEHTAHAVRRGPDGWLYVLCGNMTGISAKDATRPNGPITDPVAGVLLRFPPDLSGCDIVADGFRNAYDFDFNDHGEPFTFDSDNERCVGLPWYEGCRFYHIIPGGNYGWQAPQRGEFWRKPPYFPDVVAPLADLGRGSPTGVACYRHRQFPEKYRGGFFLADWTFGRIWFAPVEPDGSTYRSKPERFLEATGDQGFAPVALRVHPRTGDLYVAIGGRGTRGAVYRVRYTAGVKDATGFVTPPLPFKELSARINHSDPLRIQGLRRGTAFNIGRDPIFTVRQWQRNLGDIGARDAKGTVFEGYTLQRPREISTDKQAEMRAMFRRHFAKERESLDRELTRNLALIADGDPEAFDLIAGKLPIGADPADDVHYLIVLSRMTAPRTSWRSRAIADALLELDRKFVTRHLNRDRHWPLRMAELHAELARKDPTLNERLLVHAYFARPGNAVFTRAPGFDRMRAAELFLQAAEKDRDFAWSAELVALMQYLPAERQRPVLLRLWDRGGFEEAILPILAKAPQPDDRAKFLDGLNAPQLAQIKVCLEGLEKLPSILDATELLPVVRALRSLPVGKAENPVAERLAAYLRRATGKSFGADRADWTEWFAQSHPELAAKLGGPDGVDVPGWQKRFSGIDWSQGDSERGKEAFTRASCATCHSGGQALGPDLRGVTARFSRDDLLTAIVQPSKDVASRYRTTQITTTDGKVYQGLIVYEAVDGLILQSGAAATVRIGGAQIESRSITDRSLMPAGLLDKLSDREIGDLLAYLKGLK